MEISDGCDEISVTLQYCCQESTKYPFPDPQTFESVCDRLNQSFPKHYDKTLTIGTEDYDVYVSGDRVKANNCNDYEVQVVELQWGCGIRGSNFLVTPAFIPYCEDEGDSDFFDTVGHEFGHAILVASKDIPHSLTHKGSSTASQNVAESAPDAICDGSITMDIMNYFQNYADECFVDPEAIHRIKGDGFYDNIELTEADTQGLVMRAKYVTVPSNCPQGIIGDICAVDNECLNGLSCINNVECGECEADRECFSNQYCFQDARKGYRCLDRKLDGAPCDRDRHCISGHCNNEGKCGEDVNTTPATTNNSTGTTNSAITNATIFTTTTTVDPDTSTSGAMTQTSSMTVTISVISICICILLEV